MIEADESNVVSGAVEVVDGGGGAATGDERRADELPVLFVAMLAMIDDGDGGLVAIEPGGDEVSGGPGGPDRWTVRVGASDLTAKAVDACCCCSCC